MRAPRFITYPIKTLEESLSQGLGPGRAVPHGPWGTAQEIAQAAEPFPSAVWTQPPYLEGEKAEKHGAGLPTSRQQCQDLSFNSADMAKCLLGP